MVSEFSRRPRLLKGALVAYESHLIPGIPKIVAFQFNPDTVTRRLQSRTYAGGNGGDGGGTEGTEVPQIIGPPEQSIGMSVTLDAADQLEFPDQNPDVVGVGLHPALATLELLLYPPSESILTNIVQAKLGSRSVVRADVPVVLLVWGPARVVPVRMTGFSVTEQAFDQLLNPIRAEVRLDLDVLSSLDLEPGTLGHGVAFAHHVAKELLSAAHQGKTAVEIGSALPF